MAKKGGIIDNLLHKKAEKHPLFKQKLTFGQRAADKVTTFCGSWTFIFMILVFVGIWIFLNLMAFIQHWDPWPFIILNLALSCLAALLMPTILMSQNRQAQRDRIDAKYNYGVNRKAEREIQNMQKDLDEIKGAMIKELRE